MDRKELNKLIEKVKDFSIDTEDLLKLHFYFVEESPKIFNRFRKHFCKDIIFAAIDRLQKGLISNPDFYLWCDVYRHIIQHNSQPKNVSVFESTVIYWSVDELLKNLSHRHVHERKKIANIKKMLNLHDELYQNLDDLEITGQAIKTIHNDKDNTIFAVNHKQKVCYILSNYDYEEMTEESKAKVDHLQDKAKNLEKKGYIIKTNQLLLDMRYKGPII